MDAMEIENYGGDGTAETGDEYLPRGIRECLENNNRGAMYLVWEDLSVVLPNFGNGRTRRLLDGLTGFAEPGRIMAIMGPSGSGKSTLLDSLAGTITHILNNMIRILTLFITNILYNIFVPFFQADSQEMLF